ncbi:MAG: hypothetical protein JO265_07735 [Acidimicrobiia bacterium]|nr:hypothetical protein [Acidimicrobiia bacterium]
MRRVAAVGAAIGLLATACGGAATPAAVLLLRDSAKRTTDAGTSRMEIVVERPPGVPGAPAAPPGAVPAAAPITITGEADYRAHRGDMLIDLSQFGLPGPPIDAVFDNATLYEKLPQVLGSALPPGKSWVKIDLATAGRSVGVDVGALSQAQFGDPSQTLDYLRGTSNAVARVGSDVVRGTPTTHYRATVDLRKAANMSPTGGDAIRSTIKLLGSANQPVDVWIDAQGRARRMSYTADLSTSKAGAAAGAGSVTLTLELFDFGVPVQVVVPSADQVADLSALSGGR